MFRIEWEFDKISESKIDPDDLLGSIKLISRDRIIQDTCTYIDVWFDALVEGFYQIESNRSLDYDLQSEPHKLIFEPSEKGLIITYSNSSIRIDSLDEYGYVLFAASQKLLNQIEQFLNSDKKMIIKDVLEFVEVYRTTTDSTT